LGARFLVSNTLNFRRYTRIYKLVAYKKKEKKKRTDAMAGTSCRADAVSRWILESDSIKGLSIHALTAAPSNCAQAEQTD